MTTTSHDDRQLSTAASQTRERRAIDRLAKFPKQQWSEVKGVGSLCCA